jgi:ketosteroid isomerase-like protein
MTGDDETARAEILSANQDQNAALVQGDTGRLDQLLADDFVAVHITGYEQSKAEWLAQIESGRMAYHGLTEVSASLTVDGDRAVLVTRNLVDATIYGSRGTWPLQATTTYARIGHAWKAVSSQAATY